MESQDYVRRIQRRYYCVKCGNIFSKLADPNEDFVECTKSGCDWLGEEISEERYKLMKSAKEKKTTTTSNNTNQQFSSNSNFNNSNSNQQNNIRFNFNMGGGGMGNMPGNNFHQFFFSNDPFQSLFNDSMFGSFFQSPLNRYVTRINLNENIFNPDFAMFGSANNDTFRDNFSSNFRSSFINNESLLDLLNQLRQRQRESRENPTSKEALSKMKTFKMDKTYCKKKDDGELENPNCIVCMTDIEMEAETLMIPCGHMFHIQCIKIWLEKHNTCPVCRFELPSQ